MLILLYTATKYGFFWLSVFSYTYSCMFFQYIHSCFLSFTYMSCIKQGNNLSRTHTNILFLFVLYTLLTEPTKENSFSEELFIIVFPWLLNTMAGTVGAQMIFAEWIMNEPVKTVLTAFSFASGVGNQARAQGWH